MTAALTIPPVDMQAILDGRQWLYLAPEKVREVTDRVPRMDGSEVWVERSKLVTDRIAEKRPDDVRERSVPVVPPAPVTCPECDGDGTEWWGKYDYDGNRIEVYDCLTCGGSGTVPGELLLCAEQWRWNTMPTQPWNCSCPPVVEPLQRERRPAGLVLVPQPTYLPVVGSLDWFPAGPLVIVFQDGKVEFFQDGQANELGVDLTDEPYASALVPGAVLVTWDRAEVLDPPIVEMACGCPRFRPDLCQQKPRSGYDECRVPLSVGTGFTTLEVER